MQTLKSTFICKICSLTNSGFTCTDLCLFAVVSYPGKILCDSCIDTGVFCAKDDNDYFNVYDDGVSVVNVSY